MMNRTWKGICLLLMLSVTLWGCAAKETPDTTPREGGTTFSSEAPTTLPTEQTTLPAPEESVMSTQPLAGWQELDGKRYYYSETGEPLTGWITVDADRYYLDGDGAVYTGWLEDGQDRYYLRDDGTMAVGQVQIDGVSHFFTAQGKYVVLVNRWNPVPEDYQLDLVKVEGKKVQRVCAEPLKQMLSDCQDAGFTYQINSAYRSLDSQQNIWDRRYGNYIDAGYSPDEANRLVGQSVAVPGTSEHHLGLAVDIDGQQGVLEWLSVHCWEYGFIVRYPEGKTDLTGIIYEPWHFRYVGTELAAELHELDLCMEEYMQMLTQS